jgi:hypothetical protein
LPVAQTSSPPSQAASEQQAKPWLGRNAEIEAFLKTAPIARDEEVPLGVTKPRHVFFALGGPVESAAVKALPPGLRTGFFESYKSEIAAYELDRLLELNMVPVTVERRYAGQLASAQFWVNGAVLLKELKDQQAPNPVVWTKQLRRWRVFDNLIANIDRNEGNLLVVRNPDWYLVLIDHSRAFTSRKQMIFEMTAIDRPLFERLKALDKPTLDDKLGKLLVDGSKAVLQRRDAIVAHFEKLAAQKGADVVFTP